MCWILVLADVDSGEWVSVWVPGMAGEDAIGWDGKQKTNKFGGVMGML